MEGRADADAVLKSAEGNRSFLQTEHSGKTEEVHSFESPLNEVQLYKYGGAFVKEYASPPSASGEWHKGLR